MWFLLFIRSVQFVSTQWKLFFSERNTHIWYPTTILLCVFANLVNKSTIWKRHLLVVIYVHIYRSIYLVVLILEPPKLDLRIFLEHKKNWVFPAKNREKFCRYRAFVFTSERFFKRSNLQVFDCTMLPVDLTNATVVTRFCVQHFMLAVNYVENFIAL